MARMVIELLTVQAIQMTSPPHHNIKGSGDGGCPLKSYLMCSTAPYDNIQV